jgi:cysteine desulfurase
MLEPSPVLRAMGVDAEHSLRISVGWSTTDADVARFAEVVPGIVERLRALRTA